MAAILSMDAGFKPYLGLSWFLSKQSQTSLIVKSTLQFLLVHRDNKVTLASTSDCKITGIDKHNMIISANSTASIFLLLVCLLLVLLTLTYPPCKSFIQ